VRCEHLCLLSDEELGKRDIAEVNLAAAYGLPQADCLDIPALCRKLDHWAGLVRLATENVLGRHGSDPDYSEYTEAQFRMLVMITVLQRNLGVRYNLAFSRGEYDAADSRDLFIHGLLTGHGGTCVTMPMLYTAVGRRLGYPLKLVPAKEHLFCRWDDLRGERFNIEATSPGFTLRSDEHYLTWPSQISEEELECGWFLHSLSPRQELALFLHERGICCIDNLQMHDAVEAFYYAHQLAPDYPDYHTKWGIAVILARAVDETGRQSEDNSAWPVLRMPAPREDWERRLHPLAEETLRRVLRNRRVKREAAAVKEAFSELSTTLE
jgi:hypothetical protein